jgi:glycerol-3-phosphate acyltransferase PlsY
MIDRMVILFLAYLIGSIPVGYLMGRAKGIDLREHGSGNIGATNAGRVLGQPWGALCFIADVLKGALPALAAGWWSGALAGGSASPAEQAWWIGAALAAVAGHIFPVWLGFRGGKGVATSMGALGALWPIGTIPTAAALAVWLVSLRVTRYVGVSSCLAAAAMPGAAALASLAPIWGERPLTPMLIATSALAALVIWRHRGNLRRTLAGEEPRTRGRAGRSSAR